MVAMTLWGVFHARVFKGTDCSDDANFTSFIGEVIMKMRRYPDMHSVLVVDDSYEVDELREMIEKK